MSADHSTPPPTHPADSGDTTASPSWQDRLGGYGRKAVVGGILLLIAVIAYFILAAFLPRWWAGVIGDYVDRSFARGIWTGLALGFLCTVAPLILLGFALLSRGRLRNIPALFMGLVAIVAAVPNFLTLFVVLGAGNGAHAGQRILDVDAPGFRGAMLWGVIVAVVVAAALGFFVWRYRSRGRKLKPPQ